MHCKGQSMHFSLYTLLLSYLLLLSYFGCRCVCMVLIVLKAILALVTECFGNLLCVQRM
jgi:hypothetical protein